MASFAVERDGAIAVLRYGHAPRNFLTARALVELAARMRELERDPSVRVVVLTGDDGGEFMLHLQVDELTALVGQLPRLPAPVLRMVLAAARGLARLCGRWPGLGAVLLGRSNRAVQRAALIHMMIAFAAVERSSKITIAAINGSCIGGGLELALCCDHRVMAGGDDARIGLPEILAGLVPGFGGSQRLMRLIGPQPTLAMLLDGALLTGERAAALGLVTPAATLWPEVTALARRLARRSPAAVAAVKRLVRDGGARSLADGLALELVTVARLSATPDARADLAAYRASLTAELTRPIADQRSLAVLALGLDRDA